MGELFNGAGAIGRLLEQILPSGTRGAEYHPPAIRAPDRVRILPRTEGRSCGCGQPYIPEPDVIVLLRTDRCDSRSVGRETGNAVGAFGERETGFFTAAIDPHQPAYPTGRGFTRRVHEGAIPR